jgi:DNA-binding transcriptional ArsR family regulator
MSQPTPHDADIAAVGALLGEPVRAAMLTALIDGRALPAGELARLAGVSPATATGHLHRLVAGGLVRVRSQGRHRYHELASPEVGAAIEALSHLAPPLPVRSLRQHQKATALREARTCYDHLAGRLGVELRDRLLQRGALRDLDGRDHELTAAGERLVARLGVDVAQVRRRRRVWARSCLDWSQRRPHLAGSLPAAITARFLAVGWFEPRRADRGLTVPPDGLQSMREWLDS